MVFRTTIGDPAGIGSIQSVTAFQDSPWILTRPGWFSSPTVSSTSPFRFVNALLVGREEVGE